VRIDDDGASIPISERVKTRYVDRVKKYGKGLLNFEEREKYEKDKVSPL
jgi:hypothetical protein